MTSGLICIGRLSLVVAIGAVAAGCTHLEVHRGIDGPHARSGYQYMLDYTQFDVVLTRTLLSCTPGEVPRVKIEATPTAVLSPDGEQVYVIDPGSLISAFKTTEVSVDYKNGRLVGFNAATEDKTGDVIASVAKTAGKIATLAAGLPIPVAGGGKGVSPCTPEAEKNLAIVKDNKDVLVDQAEKLQDAQEQLTQLTSAYAVSPTEKLRKQLIVRKAAVADAKKQLDTLTKKVSEAQDWLKDSVTVTWPESSLVGSTGAKYALRNTTMDKWFDLYRPWEARNPPTVAPGGKQLRNAGAGGNAARLGKSDAEFARLYPELVKANFDPNNCGAPSSDACEQYKSLRHAFVKESDVAPSRLAAESAVSFHLVRQGSYGVTLPAEPKPAPAAAAAAVERAKLAAVETDEEDKGSSPAKRPELDGLRYRVPAAGFLVICEREQNCVTGGEKPVSRTASPIAQMGLVYNIPFSSPLFASGNISVTFDEQGRLLKAGLRRTNSSALTAANAAGSVVDEAGKYVKARDDKLLNDRKRDAEIAELNKKIFDAEKAMTKSPLELAQDNVALFKVQNELATLTAGVEPARLKAELTNQVERAKLEVEKRDLEKKMEDDPNADQEAMKARYAGEAAVNAAKRSSTESETSLIRAQRELDKVRAGAP